MGISFEIVWEVVSVLDQHSGGTELTPEQNIQLS